MNIKRYRYNGEKKFRLEDYSTTDTAEFFSREAAEAQLATNQEQMSLLQERLYAENKEAVLIIFQAMDAAGKDSAVKHVMRGRTRKALLCITLNNPAPKNWITIICGAPCVRCRREVILAFLTAPITKMFWL